MLQRILAAAFTLLSLVFLGMVSAQFLRETKVEAQSGNRTPIILSPAGNATIKEGETLAIPFQINEPENDIVDYFVEYLVGGQVKPFPAGAQLWQDPRTGERTFYWQTSFQQAGLHTFRFRARDDGGLESSKTITVTVNDATGAPAVQFMFNPQASAGRPVPPGSKVSTEGLGGATVILITGRDPEGDSLTFNEVQGFPNGQFQVDGPASARWYLPLFYDLLDGNTREGIVAVTDSQGNRAEARISVEYRKVTNPLINDQVTIFPFFSINSWNGFGDGSIPVVRGTANLNLSLGNRYGQTLPPDRLAKVRLQYLLYADGDTLGKPISPVLTGSFAHAWDTTRFLDGSPVPDGAQALSVRFFDADSEDMRTLMNRPITLVTDNTAGVVQGPQRVPVTRGSHDGREVQQGIDWVTYPGFLPHAAHPLAYRFVAPARSRPEDSAVWFDRSNWFTEPLIQGIHGHYEAQSLFNATRDGHIYAGHLYQQNGTTAEGTLTFAKRHPNIDGQRNDNSISPYVTFRPIPNGPGFYFLETSGRFGIVTMDGTLTTLAGHVTRRDIPPWAAIAGDTTVTTAELYARQKELRGNFQGGVPFEMPIDLVVDPRNERILYIADTGNHRIAKVDLSGPVASISTYAGLSGAAGFADGPAGQARFNAPYSIEMIADGTIYVADRSNHAIRKIAPDGTVSTLIQGTVAGLQNFDPQVLRLDSLGNLIIGDEMNGRIVRLNPQSGQATVVVPALPGGWGGDWIWLDVDKWGNVGPKDDILFVASRGDGNQAVWRYSADGARAQRLSEGSNSLTPRDGIDAFVDGQEPAGHYPWAVAIDDEEGRWIATGFGSNGIYSHRTARQEDPRPDFRFGSEPYRLYSRGWYIFKSGSVQGFPGSGSDDFSPPSSVYSRPAFSGLYGPSGDTRLSVTNLDDLWTRSNVQLAQLVQNGMEGAVPRREVSGLDLLSILYFLRMNMLDGKLQGVDPNQIKADLVSAGSYNPNDTRQPEIRQVSSRTLTADSMEVSWLTDEPTLGVLFYGLTDYYGLTSPIEETHSKTHALTLTSLVNNKTYHFQIRSKDLQGNQTVTPDLTFTLGTPAPDTTPPVITNVRTQNLRTTGADVTWTTDEASDSQVEYGLTTGYGSSSPLNATLVTNHTIALSGLAKSALYHYRVKSKDASGNRATSSDLTFTTPTTNPNQAPTVNAGADQMVTLPASANLDGTVADDDLPDPPKRVTVAWSKVSGPGTVTFGNATTVDTTATFSLAGTYVLRLTGNDSLLSGNDDVQVTVHPAGGGGLRGAWKLDDGTGTVAKDASGNSNDGTLVNGPTWTAGRIGGALRFDGTDDYVNIPGGGSMNTFMLANFSISIWIKGAAPAAFQQVFANSQFSPSVANGIQLSVNGSTGKTRVDFTAGGAVVINGSEGTINVNDTVWHHVVITRAGSTVTQYVDAVSAKVDTGASGDASSSVGAKLGKRNDDISGQYWTGLLDDPCILDRALTPAEVVMLWNNGTGAPCSVLSEDGSGGPPPSITSVRDGAWKTGSTWDKGRAPVAADDVRVKHLVTMDEPWSHAGVDAKTVTVSDGGVLKFPENVATGLDLQGSLIVAGAGSMVDLGSAARPLREQTRLSITGDEGKMEGGKPHGMVPDCPHAKPLSDIGFWFYKGGKLSVEGVPLKTWYKLAAPATAGSKTIVLPEAPGNWRVGDRIVVSATEGPGQSEEKIIESIAGAVVTLTEPLEHFHRAFSGYYDPLSKTLKKLAPGQSVPLGMKGVEMRGEVGLLSQRITIGSPEDAAAKKTRAHMIATCGGSADVKYATLRNLDPSAKLGRYAFHVHHSQDPETQAHVPSSIEDASMWNSGASRGIVFHGTDGNRASGNFSYMTRDSGYIEDATEHGNLFERNLVVGNKGPIGDAVTNQVGVELGYDIHTSGGFWPRDENTFIGNVVSDSEGTLNPAFVVTSLVRAAQKGVAGTVRTGNEAHTNAGEAVAMFGSTLMSSFEDALFWRNGKTQNVDFEGSAQVRKTVYVGNGGQEDVAKNDPTSNQNIFVSDPEAPLCLSVESSARKRLGKGQEFSKVTVTIRSDATGGIALQKMYASNVEGKVIVPAGDLSQVEDDTVTPYKVSAKIGGHLGLGKSGVTDLHGKSDCLLLGSASPADANNDGKAILGDIVALIRYRAKGEGDAQMKEIFLENPRNVTLSILVEVIRKVIQGAIDL